MLRSLIDEVQPHRKRFTVYATDDQPAVRERFGETGVSIDHRPLPAGGPEPFVVIHDSGEFAGAVSLTEFEELLRPPIHRPGDRDSVSAGYRALFDVLDDTVFSSLDRRQLLGASREIEDRAFRVGHGVLRVGFQRLSVFDGQADTYRHLGSKGGLDVHVYGLPDWDPPAIDGVVYHGSEDPAVGRYWALAFDGGVDERQACALLAREDEETYTGFWTYDPDIVGTILDDLAAFGE